MGISNIEFENFVKEKIKVKLGENKLNEILRLIFEIQRREKISFKEILNFKEIEEILKNSNLSPSQKFFHLKRYLLKRRYPNIPEEKWKYIYLNKLEISEKRENPYKGFQFERIFIEEEVKDSEFTKKILKKLPSVEVKYIKNLKSLRKNYFFDKYDLRKNDIFIFKEKFDFFKKCPCSKNAVSCNYYILNIGFGCPYDCTYCYLQHYTNFPGIFLEAEIENFLNNFEKFFLKEKFFRCGTGEFTDSLALDNLTEYSKVLVPFFSKKNVLLELKTKSKNIENLIGLEPNGRIVISWSLNSRKIIEEEEKGCASLSERILAAKECQKYGYKIGFHFDPIIFYEGWETDYKKVLEELFKNIKEEIAWISLGTLRFNPDLKKIIEKRHPETDIIYQEQILGFDRKLRYDENLRIEIYKKMLEWIREERKDIYIYLCMEEDSVWKKIFKNFSKNT
jgi:spore photoproduct lyase